MKIDWSGIPDKQALAEIGKALKKRRVNVNRTQDEVAQIIGCNISTVRKIEQGKSVSTLHLVSYVRAIDQEHCWGMLFPDFEINPFLLEKLKNKAPKRASHKRKKIIL